MGGSASFPKVKLPSDRVIIVTGGNTGIGYVMAKKLAQMGGQVILACRSEQRATQAIENIRRECEEEQKKKKDDSVPDAQDLQLEYMHLDLSSLQSTMNFINEFKQTGRKLHILMCNAGVMAPPWGHTDDGYETQFQINYLGHFLIVAHLLPILKESGDDCRIVHTSSSAHQAGRFNLETIQAPDKERYSRFTYYGNTKMYQVMQSIFMAPRLAGSNVSMTSFHPGVVDTELPRNLEDHWVTTCFCCFKCCLRTPAKGAETGVYLAVSPDVKGQSGGYYVDCRLKTPTTESRNKTYQEQLWQYTVDCLKDLLPPGFS